MHLVQPMMAALLRRWRAVLLTLVGLSLLLLLYLQTPPVKPPAAPQQAAAPLLYNEDGTRRVHPDDPPPPGRSQQQQQQQSAGGVSQWRTAVPAPAPPDGAPAERLQQPGQPPYVPARRVVHLDLKGAPPRVEYLLRLFPLLRQLGATDLLFEWEDMFPFSGPLRKAAARNHYSVSEVRRLLSGARAEGLRAIPLVQTFGHLEPFLKLEQFAHLREVPEFPAAICPSRNSSRRLVETIVDQVMVEHGDAEYLHIGCDEVYHMARCALCRRRQRDDLFLEHVSHVAGYVRRRYPHVTPLIWDDMLRHMTGEALRRSPLGRLVEPMVWVYAEEVDRFAGPHIYQTYAEVFRRVWAASAYKGAFGETLTVPPLRRHLDNTLNWLSVMGRESARFPGGFAGLVLTGWQRYDHMAVLCELLPSAIPSLGITLATASRGFYNASLRRPLSRALRCQMGDQQPFPELDPDDPAGYHLFSGCRFPGVQFFKFLSRYERTVEQAESFIKTATAKGWLTEYSIARNYTNPFRVDEVLEMYYGTRYSLTAAIGSVKSSLKDVMDRYTVAEWVEQKIYPLLQRLERLYEQGEAVKRRRVWPRRPLPLLPALAQFGLNVTETGSQRRA